MQIRKDFQNLIPPLSDAEFKQLEQSILDEGCRDPLVVWQGFLVDGHNRYAICKKHNIKFQTKEKQFDSEADVKIWIITNQLARRNLSAYDRSVLALRMKDVLTEQAEQRMKAGKKDPTQTSAEGETRDKLAEIADTSHDTINKVEVIEAEATQEQKEQLKKGKVTVNRVYQDIKKEERRDKIAKEIKEIKFDTKDKKYRVIYADPPWKYDSSGLDEYGPAERHYPPLTITELCEFTINKKFIKELVDKDAVLFMWATSPMLEVCFKVIKAWGFKYKSSFVWNKVKHNYGHYNSVRHEFLLIATKGSCVPDHKKLLNSVVTIERSKEHSEKPEEFRTIIETLYTHGNKLELFGRKKVKGWDVYGNQL